MSTDGLSPPGSSQYDTNTFYVGDGTWDASRNTFLLPNLVGLNLATTQYNGMANRFREMPGYSTILIAHGVIAGIIFLLLVPAAIAVIRFQQRRRMIAMKIHVWIQILVVFLLTVVFILGNFAVGPKRSLTNPHHGIGVALYVLVLIQVIGGAAVRHLERKRNRDYISVKTMLHHWFGRAIALLGIAQVPLGLTLYGAAQAWFVIYALIMAAWVILWFVLSYRMDKYAYAESDYDGSHTSRDTRSHRSGGRSHVAEERREKQGSNFLRNTAIVGGGLAALRAITNRGKRKEEEDRRTEVGESVISSRPHSRQSRHSRHTSGGSYAEDEKYDVHDTSRPHTWRDRILGATAGVAAFAGLRRVLGGRRDTYEGSDMSTYSRPPLSEHTRPSRTDISRVEAGEAPYSPADRRRREDRYDESVHDSIASPTRPARVPGRSRLRPRRSGSFSSISDSEVAERPPHAIDAPPPQPGFTRGQGIAATLAGVTGVAWLRNKQRQRRERRERERLDDMRRYDEEIDDRVNQTQQHRPGFGESVVDVHEGTQVHGSHGHPPVPQPGSMDTTAPPLPLHAAGTDTYSSASRPTTRPGYPVDDSNIPIPTGPGPNFAQSNTSRVRFQDELLATGASAGAAALAAHTIAEERRHHDQRRPSSPSRVPAGGVTTTTDETSTTTTGDGPSAPVRLQVNIHDDKQHVTLQRVPETPAQRRERRALRSGHRRSRADSSSGLDSEGDVMPGYRRRPTRLSAAQPITNIPAPPPPGRRQSFDQHQHQQVLTPPPKPPAYSGGRLPGPPPGAPPVPVHGSPYAVSSPPAGVTSPVGGGGSGVYGPVSGGGGYETANTTGTGTEMSAFDDNRRRRRAERAARERLGGGHQLGTGAPGPGGAGGGVRGDYT